MYLFPTPVKDLKDDCLSGLFWFSFYDRRIAPENMLYFIYLMRWIIQNIKHVSSPDFNEIEFININKS